MSACDQLEMISFLQWMSSRPRTWPNCHGFGISCVMGFISHGREKCYGYIPLQKDGRSVYRKVWWMRPGGWLSCQHARNTDGGGPWVKCCWTRLIYRSDHRSWLTARAKFYTRGSPCVLSCLMHLGIRTVGITILRTQTRSHRTGRRGMAWMTGIYPLSLSQGNLRFLNRMFGDHSLREATSVARSQQKKNKNTRKRRTASRNKAKNRLFRPQKPPQQFYAAVWRGRKI